MADDPKSGTGEGAGGAGDKPTGTPPASGGETETAEQRLARLQRERDEALKKFEDEKALRLSQLAKVEEANRTMRSGGNPPTPPADPLSREIADMEAHLLECRANNVRDVPAEVAYRRLVQEREALQRQQVFERAIREAEPVFASVADDAIAERARELFETGNFRSPDLAIAAAKGERYDMSEKERARLEALANERQKELERRASSAPGVPPSSGGPGEQRTRMKFSEYDRLTKADPNGEGRRLRQQRDSGKLVLDMSG